MFIPDKINDEWLNQIKLLFDANRPYLPGVGYTGASKIWKHKQVQTQGTNIIDRVVNIFHKVGFL